MGRSLREIQSGRLLRFRVGLGLFALFLAPHLEAIAQDDVAAEQFLTKISFNHKHLPPSDGFTFETGVTQYVPLSVIMASQPSFTSIKALSELDEAHSRFMSTPEEAVNENRLAYHQGQALFPPTKYAVGVVYDGRVYLIDGHHKALLSLYLNATYIPVKIIANWSSTEEHPLTYEQFRARMLKHFYAYPNDAEGNPVDHFYEIPQLQDDPNLYLARLLIQKVKTTISLESMHLLEVSGSNRPLILKLNEGLPFIEFYIASILKKNKIKYDPSWGKHIPLRVQKRIRSLIRREARRTKTPLKDAIILDNFRPLSTHDREMDRERLKIIYKNLLRNVNCNSLLVPDHEVYVGENHG